MSTLDSQRIKPVNTHPLQAISSAISFDLQRVKLDRKKHHAAQNIKQQPAINARADRARGSSASGSCNGLFSAGFPTGVQGVLFATSTDPTNQLPTSLLGQATRPPGGSTAHLQLFKSSTGYILVQLTLQRCFAPNRDLLRISTGRHPRKPNRLWKHGKICGKRALMAVKSGLNPSAH